MTWDPYDPLSRPIRKTYSGVATPAVARTVFETQRAASKARKWRARSAGTSDTWLLDQEAFHWHLEEDDQRNPVVQLVWGKHTVGEMVLDVRDVLFVQAQPDPDGAEGHYLFELVGGQGEPGAVYHFLLAHGLEGEEEPERPGLKH